MNYRSENRSDKTVFKSCTEETQNDESAIFTGYLPPLYVFLLMNKYELYYFR